MTNGSLQRMSGHGPLGIHRENLPRKDLSNMARLQRRSSPPPCGFTIVELVITVAILAILAATAIPSFTRFYANFRVSSKTNELKAALQTARSEAQRRTTAGSVSIRSLSGTENFAAGWQIFTDANQNGAFDTGDAEVFRQEAMTGNTTVRRVTRSGTAGAFTYADASSLATRMSLTFNSQGQSLSDASAFFRICDSNQTTVPGRIIQVSVAGIITLDTSHAACS